MRPTASAMLQQNNNNNYPCLSMSASTQEMLQKCSKASLPLPGRLELSLGDLPLIRGLRAWALCSKNRRRTGNLLEGGRKAPGATPPPSASCPRPADVHLSRECWGLGMDARQARIGALVTVATLKTSDGGGKTQTQCLFLRTEKGSCLYSTRKPGSAVPPVGGKGWLGGKTGGKDTPAGRRDAGTTTSLHAEANWVRVRSGRRWRKSGNVPDVNRTRLQSRKDDGDGLRLAEKRQEKQRPGNLDRQELEKQEDQKSLGGGGESHGSLERTKRETQSEKELQTSPNKDVRSPKHEGTNHDASRSFSGNEDPPPVSTENPNFENKTCGLATDGSTSSSTSDGDGERLAEERQDEQRQGSLDRHELEECLGGGMETHGSPQSFHVGTKSEREIQTSLNKDVHSPKHEDMDHSTWRFLSETEDPLPDAPVSEIPHVEDATTGSTSSSMTSESSSKDDDNGLRLVEERQDEQRTGNLDRQELEEQEQQKSLGGGAESRGSPESYDVGTKRKTQSEKDLQRSRNEDQDMNHNALRFLSQNQNQDLVSAEKPNAEDQTCGAATQEDVSRRYEANTEQEHESTSSSVSSGSSEFGQDVNTGKQTPDQSQRAQPIQEQETQDRREPGTEPHGDQRSCGTSIEEDGGGERRKRRTQEEETKLQKPAGPAPSHSHRRDNPASFPTSPLSSSAAGGRSLGSQSESEEMTTPTVASDEDDDDDDDDDDEEEEEFGVFMQADGEVDWNQGLRTPVHCGSRESIGLELVNPAPLGEEPSHWTPAGWMDGSFHQWDDSWTAFSQDASEKGGDVGQWWPISAAEQRRDITSSSTNQDLTSIFAQAFPLLSSSSPCDSPVPTLSQLLRGGARHDQGLLDDFHDLDKMIGRRLQRASAASRGGLLSTLQLEPLNNENRNPASRRHSPGLPSANQHAHSAVPKRRLSCDSDRNVTA